MWSKFRRLVFNRISVYLDISTIPMAILGLIYLVFYSCQVLMANQPTMAGYFELGTFAIWAVFAFDTLVRLIASESVVQFLRRNWLELLTLALPFARFFRVFRVLLVVRGLKEFSTTRLASTGLALGLLIPLIWFAGAIAVLDAEQSAPNATITNLPDALWWSLATITTVGYGELYPITAEGKLAAGLLMISGIALFSAGAGMFVAWVLGDRKTAI